MNWFITPSRLYYKMELNASIRTADCQVKNLKVSYVIIQRDGDDDAFFYKIVRITPKGLWYHNCDPDGTLNPLTQDKWMKAKPTQTVEIVWEIVRDTINQGDYRADDQPIEPEGEDPC